MHVDPLLLLSFPFLIDNTCLLFLRGQKLLLLSMQLQYTVGSTFHGNLTSSRKQTDSTPPVFY